MVGLILTAHAPITLEAFMYYLKRFGYPMFPETRIDGFRFEVQP